MPIDNINYFIENMKVGEKLMSIDVSKNNLGIAVSDPLLLMAFIKPTIGRTYLDKDLKTIVDYIKKENIFALIIGLPLNKEGKENFRVQSIKTFTSNLLKIIDIPIYYQDERYSTIAIENNPYTSKKNMDSQSASWFLQIVLDKISLAKVEIKKI
jgi:putative Holliday junction resolvase